MKIKQFILGGIETNTYVVYDEEKCLLIDPAFDKYSTVENFVEQNNLKPVYVFHCGIFLLHKTTKNN